MTVADGSGSERGTGEEVKIIRRKSAERERRLTSNVPVRPGATSWCDWDIEPVRSHNPRSVKQNGSVNVCPGLQEILI